MENEVKLKGWLLKDDSNLCKLYEKKPHWVPHLRYWAPDGYEYVNLPDGVFPSVKRSIPIEVEVTIKIKDK